MENFRRFLLNEDIQEDIDKFLKELGALPPAEKIEHSRAELGYLGEGSSRIAYVLKDRVLKIAMNKAGVAQNKVEANVRTQEILKPWAAKVFDRGPDFHWILQEKVDASNNKTERVWKSTLGGIPDRIEDALRHYRKVLNAGYNFEYAWAEAQTFGPLEPIAQDLILKLHRLGLSDIGVGNTGVAPDGRPVILDAGFDESVAKIYGWTGDEGMFHPWKQPAYERSGPFIDKEGNAFGVGAKIKWLPPASESLKPFQVLRGYVLTVIDVKEKLQGRHLQRRTIDFSKRHGARLLRPTTYAIIGIPSKKLSHFEVSPEDLKQYAKVLPVWADEPSHS